MTFLGLNLFQWLLIAYMSIAVGVVIGIVLSVAI